MTEPSTTGTPLLEVRDLRTSFELPLGTVKAVDGVSLTLQRGTTLGIVGESGSGKTVLIRSIMGLAASGDATVTGSVRYEGDELVGRSRNELRKLWGREMAMIFQDPMSSLNPVVRTGRQITEHLRHHLGVSKSEATEQALGLMRSVRIPEPEARLRAYPHELSGGMRQRVSIAIALACGPKLLFADEPTTALDVTVQHQILNLLGQQQRERFMTMLLVTHDLGVVAGRTDEIVVMYAGKVVEHAPTTVLFDSLRHPYTEALLRSSPKVTNPKHTRLKAIAGRPPNLIESAIGCSFAPRCAYAQDRCRAEEPPLGDPDEEGHRFACWHPVGSDEGRAAYRANLAAGVIATLAAEGRIAASEDLAAPSAAAAPSSPTGVDD